MIREAKTEDVAEIVNCVHSVMKETWERYEKGYYPKDAIAFDIEHFDRKKVENAVASDNSFLFLDENESITGVIHGMVYGESGFGLIHWLGVEFEHRQEGIGTQLLERVFTFCSNHEIHKISLYTLPVLRPAINLYLKTGFVPEAYLKKQWWGVDFVFMSKWL
ncbi:MAG: GNAT family N-acetyltransferase [Euryarchaeota archaeon]|nr:GNAT family N-acetyltransferase [Euryarchaeota archaeon]